MLTVKEIMTRDVCTVHEDTELKDLAALFVEHNYKTMPVIDAGGKLVGVISQTDLIEQDKPLHIPTVISLFDWVIYLESEDRFRQQVEKLTAQKVGEICTREVTTCGPEATVQEIAALMVEKGVHLIPVVDKEQVVGVVARVDIIRSMGV